MEKDVQYLDNELLHNQQDYIMQDIFDLDMNRRTTEDENTADLEAAHQRASNGEQDYLQNTEDNAFQYEQSHPSLSSTKIAKVNEDNEINSPPMTENEDLN